jgi:hypothetical protein
LLIDGREEMESLKPSPSNQELLGRRRDARPPRRNMPQR